MKIPAQISILGSPESLTWQNVIKNPRKKSTETQSIIEAPKSIRNPHPLSTSFSSRRFFMACNEILTVLYLIDGQYASEVDRPKRLKKCRAFKLWSGFTPDTYYQFDLPQYTLRKGGAAIQICYQSDKWDSKLTHYFHDFAHDCEIWINKKDATLWAIKRRDGHRIVSAEGIIG